MVVVAVRIDDMLLRGGVPLELTNYILPSQWQQITNAVVTSFEEGTFWSCCCEISVCVLFFFPFVFLCHPCLSAVIIKGRIERKLRMLNQSMFNGSPVLTELDGNILINTDYIQLETVYIDRTNTGEYIAGGKSSNSGVNPSPIAQAVLISPEAGEGYVNVSVANPVRQSMMVTVPPNAGPGSVLTVSAPNGTVISVVVPQNSGPGRELIVQY